MDGQLFQTPTVNAERQETGDPESLESQNIRRIVRGKNTDDRVLPEARLVVGDDNNRLPASGSHQFHDQKNVTDIRTNMSAPYNLHSASWDSVNAGMSEAMSGEDCSRAHGRDRRKSIDLTTPTLEDENENYEEDMIAHHHDHAFLIPPSTATGDSHLRRTPGASVYSRASSMKYVEQHQHQSLRRTPGASEMHRSAAAVSIPSNAIDSIASKEASETPAVMLFGMERLTLKTPVAKKATPEHLRTKDSMLNLSESEDSFSSSSSSSSPPRGHGFEVTVDQHQAQAQLIETDTTTNRPPLVANSAPCAASQEREANSYTPAVFTLSKNPNLSVTHGAFSPHTIRLTEALDHILNDEEDHHSTSATPGFQARQQVFRGEDSGDNMAKQPQFSPSTTGTTPQGMFNVSSRESINKDETKAKTVSESWTNSYIFDNDGGKASMATSQNSLKGSDRRSRRGGSSFRRNKAALSRASATSRHGRDAEGEQPTGMLFHHHREEQQPKPMQGGNDLSINPFLSASRSTRTPTMTTQARQEPNGVNIHQHQSQQLDGGTDNDGRASPRPLNFVGAFAPPSKANMKNLRRPVASLVRRYEVSIVAASSPAKPSASRIQPTELSSSSTSLRNNRSTAVTSDPEAKIDQKEQHQQGAIHHHESYSPFQGGSQLPPNAQPFVPNFGPAPHVGQPVAMGPPSAPYQVPFQPVPMGQAIGHPGPMGPPGVDQRVSPHFHPHNFPQTPAVTYPNSQMYGFHSISTMGHPPQSISPSFHPPMGHFHGYHPPPHQQFSQQSNWLSSPQHFGNSTMHNESGWGVNATAGWSVPYGIFPPSNMQNAQRVAMSPSPPMVPQYAENNLAVPIEQMQFPAGYGNEVNSHTAQQQHHQDFQGPSVARPRIRSVDNLSPANVSIPLRDRMKSWDNTRDSQVQARNDAQQRKTPSRRQQRAQSKNKNSSDVIGGKPVSKTSQRKKFEPGSPFKKKNQEKLLDSSISEKASIKGKKKEILVGDSKRETRSNDPIDHKRAELDESQVTRTMFKNFYRNFRVKERSSFQEAEAYALVSLKDESLPEQVHWRVHLELADLAKRSNRFDIARKLYKKVCELQPYASQGWLEYGKLEEECGHNKRCGRILSKGLEYCELCDNLLARAIKHEEKMGNLEGARQLLARLKDIGIDKVWRTVLEGALLEARAGNTLTARRVLKYLMHHVPWYGPLYLEAYRLERDMGRLTQALAIVERGLKDIPRYGPLWFGAFRLCEALDVAEKAYDMPRTNAIFDRATESVSRDLMWKVHLDAAQTLERAAIQVVSAREGASLNRELIYCRNEFCKTILACPPNLCWKVWLAGGRMELSAGNTRTARNIFLQAYRVVPEKGRAAALLECSRLEEFVGDTEVARAILCKARTDVGSDWKVWLESVLLEIRCGRQRRAIDLAQTALRTHSGTGRIWACLVQLRQLDGEEAQYNSLKCALRAVPKSGEVWCESARIHLNPFSTIFDLKKACNQLAFATKFTPQYGDSFLETLKLQLLNKWIVPVAKVLWETLRGSLFEGLEPEQMNSEKFDQVIVDCVCAALRPLAEKNEVVTQVESSEKQGSVIEHNLGKMLRAKLDAKTFLNIADVPELELYCANADPNYGLLWFHCRESPTDTARTVLSRAKKKLSFELGKHAHVYIAAIIRRAGVAAALGIVDAQSINPDKEQQKALDARLRAAPTLSSILESEAQHKNLDAVLLERSSSSDFTTGLEELNKLTPLGELSLSERRKTLFGSDSLSS